MVFRPRPTWLVVAALAAAGCAPVKPAISESGTYERPGPPPPRQVPPAPPPAPLCPDAMRAQPPLERLLGEAVRPGAWHPDDAGETLGFAGVWQDQFRERLPARVPLTLAGFLAPKAVSVVLFRGYQDGVCVVNAWSEIFPVAVRALELEDAWSAPDGGLAIAIFRLQTSSDATAGLFVVLATDGETAWIPVGEPGRNQLTAERMVLRETGGRLRLDVLRAGAKPYTFVLDGRRFVPFTP